MQNADISCCLDLSASCTHQAAPGLDCAEGECIPAVGVPEQAGEGPGQLESKVAVAETYPSSALAS